MRRAACAVVVWTGLVSACGTGATALRSQAGPAGSTSADSGAVAELLAAARLPALVSRVDQAQFVELIQGADCPCPGMRGSVQDCFKRCWRAPALARSVVRQLAGRRGLSKIRESLVERFGASEAEQIALVGAPCRGAATAPVTIVVFSDFQCPFCQRSTAILDKVLSAAKGRARLCFKNLLVHKTAEPAAQAAYAAHRQARFWPYHDLLFRDMNAQELSDLEYYAGKLGLDLARWRSEMSDGLTQSRLLADGQEARRLGVRGTPSFFVNGRRMSDPKTVEFFLDWIDEAVARQQPAKASTTPKEGTAGEPRKSPSP